MNIFQRVVNWFRKRREHQLHKLEFASLLVNAAGQGKFSEEIKNLVEQKYNEFGLTRDEIRSASVEAYRKALSVTHSAGPFTSDKEQALNDIQHFLLLPDDQVAAEKRQVRHLRLLTEIQLGHLPKAEARNVVLQKNETAHWTEPASLLEERVVDRRYVGGSQGMSFRIAKGVSYRIGQQRGHLVVDKQILPVSTGSLVLTNKRVIFSGDTKSFALRPDRLINLDLYSDGVKFMDEKGKPHLLRFQDAANADIVGAILTHVINHYND